MYSRLPNRYDRPLTVTPISSLQAGAFVNIAGIICQPFQQPQLTRHKSLYLFVSLQGTGFICLVCHNAMLPIPMPIPLFKCSKSLTYITDTSCGNFGRTEKNLRLHIFASHAHEIPPIGDVGDFLFLHNVEITEWEGG